VLLGHANIHLVGDHGAGESTPAIGAIVICFSSLICWLNHDEQANHLRKQVSLDFGGRRKSAFKKWRKLLLTGTSFGYLWCKRPSLTGIYSCRRNHDITIAPG
jgi:hypothetical protein